MLVSDDRVRLITFTGSSAVGWGLRERASRKKVLLELGNATPAIVLADADLDAAAQRLSASAFAFSGQACVSVQRIYVERAAYDDFLARFLPRVEALRVGDPADESTDVGPVIDAASRDRIAGWIEAARAGGATVLAGGDETDDGLLRPTVLGNAAPELDVSCREVFGPLCTVNPVDVARRGDPARERHAVRPPGGHLHRAISARPCAPRRALLRLGARERDAELPHRRDALRRRQGVGQHEGRARPPRCAS